nr:MAG TPA: hypothetical protein [Caudoviricetes sp.]
MTLTAVKWQCLSLLTMEPYAKIGEQYSSPLIS